MLEADQTIGGRIKHHQFGDYVVENGANWIHGPYTEDEKPINNPIWNFKKKYNMSGSFTDWVDQTLMTRDGKDVSDEANMDNWWEVLDNADSFCFDKGQELLENAKRENLGTPESIDVSLEHCLDEFGYSNHYNNSLNGLVGRFLKYYEFDMSYTIPSANMSLMLWSGEHQDAVEYIDDDFLITDQRGYNIFLNEISHPFQRSIKVRHQVTHISYNNSGVKVIAIVNGVKNAESKSMKQENARIQVRAKYAICTVPLGVLQKGKIAFSPSLTIKKMASINGMKMGNYAKVYLRFPYNFWGEKEHLIILGEPIGLASVGINLDHPKYLPGSKTITFHSVGDNAVNVESQDVQKTQLDIMRELQTLYTYTIPEPDDIYVTNWTHNPFSYGSYSALPIGFTSTMWEELRKNVSNLYFSGEHTNENHSATVHGAFDAGRMTAKTILKEIEQEKFFQKHTSSSSSLYPTHTLTWIKILIYYVVYFIYLRNH